jgi:hypothetical protein
MEKFVIQIFVAKMIIFVIFLDAFLLSVHASMKLSKEEENVSVIFSKTVDLYLKNAVKLLVP